MFSAQVKDKQGQKQYLDLLVTSSISIKRHIKVRADANPYNPTDCDYFEKRLLRRRGNTITRKKGGYAEPQKIDV